VSNSTRGPENRDRPFAARRHRPGTKVNATDRASHHPVALYFSAHATSVSHAARIAEERFRVPRQILRMILNDPRRNSLVYARIVNYAKHIYDRDAGRRHRWARGVATVYGASKSHAATLRRALDVAEVEDVRRP
jgi:hypothetical protein